VAQSQSQSQSQAGAENLRSRGAVQVADENRLLQYNRPMAENSGAEPRKRGPGRPFPPGLSGNPGGRSKQSLGLESALRETHDPPKVLAVVEKLRRMALAGDVSAARVYLDRVMGPVRANDDERIDLRARELAESMLARRRRHNLTAEQIEYMATHAGAFPPGVRPEDLGD